MYKTQGLVFWRVRFTAQGLFGLVECRVRPGRSPGHLRGWGWGLGVGVEGGIIMHVRCIVYSQAANKALLSLRDNSEKARQAWCFVHFEAMQFAPPINIWTRCKEGQACDFPAKL